jgi:2-amino-4-hydroxy-6-hydroxymethyldihydropteridine diphosphokinase
MSGGLDDTGLELNLPWALELLRRPLRRVVRAPGPREEPFTQTRPVGGAHDGEDDEEDDEGFPSGQTECEIFIHGAVAACRARGPSATLGAVPVLECVVGLGSNLGDRLMLLTLAARRIKARALSVELSRVYETPPHGPPQPDYLNAAIRLEWPGSPDDLLALLLSIEASLGRVRREKWGPRTIDLDILWADGLILATPRLVVPHPELTHRAFALRPLLDLVPLAVDPRSSRPLADFARGLEPSGLRMVVSPWRV